MMRVVLLLGAGLIPPFAQAQDAGAHSIDLPRAIEAALSSHPSLLAAQATVEETQARQQQVQARPNPELELMTGRLTGRSDDIRAGQQHTLALAQPLEWPEARAARIEGAEQDFRHAEALASMTRQDLIHQVKQAFIDTLHAKELLRLNEEDAKHIEGIRDRIKAMVAIGEAPRYEGVKAEAEALVAQRQVEAARHRYNATANTLRILTGLPAATPTWKRARLPEQLDAAQLRARMLESNPRATQARALIAMGRAGVSEARADRLPPPTVRTGLDQTPDSRAWMLGLSLPLPIFDQGTGKVAAAEARLNQNLAATRQDMLALDTELHQAYHRYRGAQAQLQAIEGGLLTEAQDALRVAETAFRAGERGILDVLDARRTLHDVRLDHIHALYEIHAALFQLEHLTGDQLLRAMNP